MPDWLENFLLWWIDILLWFPRELFKLLVQALANLVNSIPVPLFIQNLGPDLVNVFAQISWFGELVMLPEGVTLVLAAYLLRFLIRRIPVIG